VARRPVWTCAENLASPHRDSISGPSTVYRVAEPTELSLFNEWMNAECEWRSEWGGKLSWIRVTYLPPYHSCGGPQSKYLRIKI
jgi:hypothetical protein